MEKLSRTDQIWSVIPSSTHRHYAADYASCTLPWTFNRMSKDPLNRGINIVKGLTAQGALQDAFTSRSIPFENQYKSYRSTDTYDLRLVGSSLELDVKAISYYRGYPGDIRPPFSLQYIIDNRDYAGRDWRRFFPMLLTHTQIKKSKNVSVFAITESVDVRQPVLGGRSFDFIYAYPHGESATIEFFGSKGISNAREQAGRGLFLNLKWLADSLFATNPLHITLMYEWDGERMEAPVALIPNHGSDVVGPMSVFSGIRMSVDAFESFNGSIRINIVRNDLVEPVLIQSTGRNVNVLPHEDMFFTRADFGNLVLPDDFRVHFLGWIEKDEYFRACLKYPGWFCPKDSQGREFNRPWSGVSQKDSALLEKLGWEDRVQGNPPTIAAGLMKTTGHQGACCYVFPNVFSSGVKETNLYVLPQDLWSMDSLIEAANIHVDSSSASSEM